MNLKTSLKAHKDRVWSLSWSPDGNFLASCSGDKSIKIWKLENSTLDLFDELDEKHNKTVRSIEWSPNGQFLACASFDTTTSVYKMENKRMVFITKIEGHESEVKSVTWSKVGDPLIATCSRDKSVWIWSPLENGEFECVSVLNGHTQDVKSVKWHPQKEILASCSYDDTIKFWAEDMDDWYCADTLKGHTSTVWSIAFNPSGSLLCSVGDDKKMILWKCYEDVIDPEYQKPFEWRIIDTNESHDRCIYTVDWSLDGKFIATGSEDNMIRIFTIEDEKIKLISKFLAHDIDVNCVSWNPRDSTILASCGDDKLIKIWSF